MELTASQWVLTAFSFVLGTVVAMVLDEFMRKRDVPAVPRGLMDALTFVGVSLLVAGMLVAPIGETLGLVKPPAPTPPVITPGPTPSNVGYVMAVVKDELAKTFISGATVGLYLTSPAPGAPAYALQTKETDANGGAFFEVPGLTSGTVYLMAYKENYYSDVKSTTIPGPQVYPTEALWAKFGLIKVGQLSGTFENLTPNISISGTQIRLDNVSGVQQKFKVSLRNEVAKTGIKDLVIQFMRSSVWRYNEPVFSVNVSAPSNITVSTEGDLNTGYQQTVKMSGVLTSPNKIEITVEITLTKDTVVNGELVQFLIDDLGEVDGKGYAGEAGIPVVEGKIYVGL